MQDKANPLLDQLAPEFTLKRHHSKYSKRIDGRNLDQGSLYKVKLGKQCLIRENCENFSKQDEAIGRWEVAVQNHHNAVYGELILPIAQNTSAVNYIVKVIGQPFQSTPLKLSLLLQHLLSRSGSQDPHGVKCKITLQIFQDDGNIESTLIRALALLVRAALPVLGESLLLDSELEAFILLKEGKLIKITNPSTLERKSAESVVLRTTTSSGLKITNTLKPGLMPLE